MKSEWKEVCLGEITKWSSGGTPSKNNPLYWNGTIPWISAKNMPDGWLDDAEPKITELGLNNGSRLAPPNSILMLVRGSGLYNRRYICITRNPVAFNQDVKCIETKNNVLPEFIYYWLRGNDGTLVSLLESTGIGAGKFDVSRLQKLRIMLPPIDQQKKLVEVVRALDDKISLNNKMNDNLEQQLFLLYSQMIGSPTDKRQQELSTLCKFQEGYVNPSQKHPEYFDGDIKWLRAVDINESFIINTSRTLTQTGFESARKSAILFKPNTIAISKSGTIGRLGIVADYMCGNRAVINIEPYNKDHLAFIYCYLKSKQKEFPDMAVGSVQKNLYISLLEPLSVTMPKQDKLSSFNKIGNTLLSMVQNNCVENIKLGVLRDTLLPKLMSGEIDVEDVKI